MESTRRIRTLIYGISLIILAPLLGICPSACSRTAEAPPSKSLPKAEPPPAKSEEKTEEPIQRRQEEAGGKSPDVMQNQEESKLPDDEEIRRYQEEMEKQRQEEEKKYWASLGKPWVDHPEDLVRNKPDSPLWINMKNKQVVMIGTVCQTEAPLEMFACQRGTKEHEAILSVPTLAQDVHFDLLLVGAKPGHPAEFGPEGQYTPAAGTEVEITVRWKDAQGKVQTARAQEWIKNMKTGEPLKVNWVFGGSGFSKDETTGKEFYKAEGGDFICISNFTSAMLDLPIASTDVNAELRFQANPARVPPLGTPVTIILSPQREKTVKSNEK